MATTISEPKEAAGLPDGLHASSGVEYLARLEGFDGGRLPATVILSVGFSETTGFFRESKGRGFWMTTLNKCSCPSFMYRGGPCKHQKRLANIIRERASPSLPAGVVGMTTEALEARRRRIDESNAARAAASNVEERAFREFNCPDEVRAYSTMMRTISARRTSNE